ncbi:MAG: hypothetical protein ABIW82_01880 [Dokdonella sp.]
MPANVTVENFTDLDAFMDRLLYLATKERNTIYRGQSDASWELRPSAWRGGLRDTIVTLYEDFNDNWHDALPYPSSMGAAFAATHYLPSRNDEIHVGRLKLLTS